MSKQPRRKNNAQSASSGRAAELLAKNPSVPILATSSVNPFMAAAAVFDDVAPSTQLDSDINVIIKKLIKRDPITREKALRELIDVSSSKNLELQTRAFQDFTYHFDKLVLDGSVSVRAYSLRVLSYFIKTLKKQSEVYFKQVVPFMIFALSDASSSVVQQAELVLMDNFPEEKRNKLYRLFGEAVARLSINFIKKENLLLEAQTYDTEEEIAQRTTRVIAQGFNTLTRLQAISPPLIEVNKMIEDLLRDGQLLKASIKESDQIKLGLLRLSTCPSSGMLQLLITSPLIKWVMENLDAKDLTVAQVCFSAFVEVVGNQNFFEKFDPAKVIIPRLLNVLRKKEIHWRVCSSYYLPLISLIHDALLDDDGRSNFLIRVLESFSDNLPFEVVALLSPWARSLCECSKFALIKQGSHESLRGNLTNLLCRLTKYFVDDEEGSRQFAELIRWMVTKQYLTEPELHTFLSTLGTDLANLSKSSNTFVCELFYSPITTEFLPLINVLLEQQYVSKDSLISCLQNSDEATLKRLVETIDFNSLLFGSEIRLLDDQLEGFSKLAIKLMRKHPSKIEIKAGSLCEKILMLIPTDELALFEQHLDKENKTAFISESILQLTIDSKPETLHKLLLIPTSEERNSQMGQFLERYQEYNIEQIILFAKVFLKFEVNFELGKKFTELLFEKLLQNDTYMSNEDLIKTFVRFTVKFSIDDLQLQLLWSIISKESSFERVEAISRLCSHLCSLDIRFDSIFPGQEFVNQFLGSIEKFTYPWILAEFPSTSMWASNFCSDGRNAWDLAKTSFRNQALAALKIATQELASRKWALCIAAAHMALHDIEGTIHFSFDEDQAPDDYVSNSFRTAIENDSNFANTIADAICNLSQDAPQLLFLALKAITKFTTKIPQPSTSSDALQRFYLRCAIKDKNLIAESMNEEERWILRFHTSSHLQFLTTLSRAMSSGTLDFELYVAGGQNERLTVCALNASAKVFSSSIVELESSLLDFVVCGLVTVFDTSNALIHEKENHLSPLVVAALSTALRNFTILSRARHSASAAFQKEWNELFYPTISQIILRLFIELVDSENPSKSPLLFPICSSICACDIEINETDFIFKGKIDPIFDNFNYSPHMQTLLSQCRDFLRSDIHHAQFAATHLLNMYAWKMYQHENGVYFGESEEMKADLKDTAVFRRPAIILKEIINTTLLFPSCLALNTALRILPLFSSHAERVSYCDALAPLVLHTLPVIISTASKFDIKKDEATTFFLQEAPLESRSTLHRFACRLLFRLVELVPALVRIWYNNLDRSPSLSVNRFFRESLSILAIEEELRKVRNDNELNLTGDNELKVRTFPAAGEVVAEYKIEETTMRLVIVLPPDWPLRVPQISLDKAVVASDRAKKWLLQLTAFLFHQNGPIIEGLAQWKRQVDREVEGAEACTICMMSVHSTSHQLPRVKCKQCKNKFHSNCLYKWFESSNQSSCPLCRANFT